MTIKDVFNRDQINKSVYIIAELSANHNQVFEKAVQSIKAAKECGVDAIKLQTYTADTITIDSDNKYFRIQQGTLWDGKTLYQLYKEAYTPWDWQPKLKRIAEQEGLECLSSPFDHTAVDFLETMDVPAYKVASFEITDIPLIEYIASKKKPVIISTGIAGVADITDALDACRRMNNNQVALLKCTSSYPAPVEEANLSTIPDLRNKFDVVPGLSDHTIGNSVAIAAVALGAKIIEKHFILDRTMGGPDAEFSMEPKEFKSMVNAIREVEKAIGEVSYKLSEKMKKNRNFSRSLFVVKEIKAGEMFTEENVRSIRPGNGISPKFYRSVLGKRSKITIERGTPLSWEFIDA